MKRNTGFRGWFYFRIGWSTYFAFLFAAVNTLTVTYYLAIERAPFLQTIFPSFVQYVLIVGAIGVPLLLLIGYVHYKRSAAYRSEADIWIESNPYQARWLVNSELILSLNVRLTELVLKLTKNEKLSESELDEITKLQEEISDFIKNRTFSNMKDRDYFKKLDK